MHSMRRKKKTKLRRVGDIMLEIEPLILELGVDHDLQWSEILGLVYAYLKVHLPGQQEEYVDGGSPEYYYGPKEKIIRNSST